MSEEPTISPDRPLSPALVGEDADPHGVAEPEPAGAPAPQPFVLGNRPALTGLRFIILTPILVFHTNFTTLPGSWIVLSVFFVLSGFLITTMLGTEHRRTGRISLGNFYSRRAIRLLPPLLLTVTLLAVYAAFVSVSDAAQRIWGDSAAALFYYADYRQAFEHNPLYSGFLTQCWSLAVEEQFYLIWAALLLVALKFGRRKLAYAMVFAGILGSAGNRVHIVLDAHPWTIHVADRVYYAFDTRADALFLGCLMGLLATGGHFGGWPRWAKNLLVVAALGSTALMIWMLFSITLGERSLPLVWMPTTEICAALIILYFVIHPEGLGTRVVGVSLLVLAGEMSYTMYLIHFPVYVAVSPSSTHLSYWEADLVRAAIIISLALASWYLMERPLTRWRRRSLDPSHSSQSVDSIR